MMIGDRIALDALFPTNGDGPFKLCELRMTALTNSGVVSFVRDRLIRSEREAGRPPVGPGAMFGGCVATFSDRFYEVPEPPRDQSGVTLMDAGVQRFSAREIDVIFVDISGPHPLEPAEFRLQLRFGSINGEPMIVPAHRDGDYLIGKTPVVRGGQTLFSMVFLETALAG
jgi:hypothetical protein